MRVDGRGKGRGKWLKRELGQVVHGGQRGGRGGEVVPVFIFHSSLSKLMERGH